VISLLAGVAFSPYALNFIDPLNYAAGSLANLNAITLNFSRLVLGIQLILTGVQLPARYLRTEWKSLLVLLGPIMTCMWLVSSTLIWAMVPKLSFLHALAVGACVTPTDPILSSGIVKGRFADTNVPKGLQRIIIAESGANDGLGYPFLFLALYMIKYSDCETFGQTTGAQDAMRLWLGETWGYVIILSIAYGAAVGWIARELLQRTEEKNFVDRESFLIFAIALALFIVGSCGLICSDDVLACFVAGNVFTWDDWFRLKTLDDSLQPTIDMLLNLTIFVWFGAICPWPKFIYSEMVPVHRLLCLGILILLLRRLPIVFALRKFIPQIEDGRQAIFVGFFGPIGVSAIFYLYIGLDFLEGVTDSNGLQRADAAILAEVMTVVIWFLTVCSIVRIHLLRMLRDAKQL
jgi:sodium/hydrogen antiporter